MKVYKGAVRSEVEQCALDFQCVFVLPQPVEELEDVLPSGVESAVFVMVPAQIAQQGGYLVPVPAVVRFGPRPCGKATEEPFFSFHGM